MLMNSGQAMSPLVNKTANQFFQQNKGKQIPFIIGGNILLPPQQSNLQGGGQINIKPLL
jgi:hypothetical protein